MRLAELAIEHWRELDGYAASRNMPELTDLPLGRFCNFVLWWATKDMQDEQSYLTFEAQLWRPPKGQAVDEGPWSPQAETEAFQALRKMTGG